MICVTLGTGIGGGIILNGQLFRGRYGVGAEIGHYRVVPDGRLCGCGNRGCWEKYASGRALVAEARTVARDAPERAERLRKLAGGDPERIEGHHITQAALEGDAVALECFAVIGDWVGQGLADLASNCANDGRILTSQLSPAFLALDPYMGTNGNGFRNNKQTLITGTIDFEEPMVGR